VAGLTGDIDSRLAEGMSATAAQEITRRRWPDVDAIARCRAVLVRRVPGTCRGMTFVELSLSDECD
jgi:hypothetical protein